MTIRALFTLLALATTPAWADTACHQPGVSSSFSMAGTNGTGSGAFSSEGDGFMTIITDGGACSINVSKGVVTASGNCAAAESDPNIHVDIRERIGCLLAKITLETDL